MRRALNSFLGGQSVGCSVVNNLSKRAGLHNPVNGTSLGSLKLVQGSFFDYDISDADVIFMNNVLFTEVMI